MREIFLCVLLILPIINAEECPDGFYISSEEVGCIECVCDNIGSIDNVCDKQSGKCKCLPGFLGDRCEDEKCISTCYEIVQLDFRKLHKNLQKLRNLEVEIANTFNATVLDSMKKQLENLQNNIIKLSNYAKTIIPVDTNFLINFEKHAKTLQKEIHDLTKMYSQDADHQKLLHQFSNGISEVKNITQKADDLQKELQALIAKLKIDQENFDKIAEESSNNLNKITNVTKSLENVMNYVNSTCLDIIDFMCGNNQTEEIERLKSDLLSVDTKRIHDRINSIKTQTLQNTRKNEVINNNINGILPLPPLPSFNREKYDGNGNKITAIKNLQNTIDSVDRKANSRLNSANDTLQKVNILKAVAFNKIIIAPAEEILQKIKTVRESSKQRKKIDEIVTNVSLADDKLKQINIDLTSIIEQRDRLILEIERNMHILLRHEGDIKLLHVIKKLQNRVLDIDKYYKTTLEDLRSTYEDMENKYKEIETGINADIDCMKNESKNIDQELLTASEEMSKLEEELDRVEDAVTILKETEDISKKIKEFDTVIKELNDIRANATTLCPVYDLNR